MHTCTHMPQVYIPLYVVEVVVVVVVAVVIVIIIYEVKIEILKTLRIRISAE